MPIVGTIGFESSYTARRATLITGRPSGLPHFATEASSGGGYGSFIRCAQVHDFYG